MEEGDGARMEDRKSESTQSSQSAGRDRSSNSSGMTAERRKSYPVPDDESAATGIGRNVRNDVRWVNMELEPRAAGEVTIRYEYREGLVRLGIIPRSYPYSDSLRRREGATGFEDRGGFSPEP